MEIVRLLKKHPKINPAQTDALVTAASRGHSEIISELLSDPRVDPNQWNGVAIKFACANLHKEAGKSHHNSES